MELKRQGIVAIESSKALTELASFLAVVSAGSFTRAATLSGVDKTVLSRRVRRLEDALEVRLLNRTTRSMHVTDAGRRLVDRASEPLSEVLLALAEAQSADVVRGEVRVSSLSALAPVLAEALTLLRRRHPELHVQLHTSDAFLPLVDRGFDVAIRSGHLPDSSLVARKLAEWRYVLVASPAWASAHPDIATPADVASHWLLYSDLPRATHWRFERSDAGVDVDVQPVASVGNAWVLRELALQGLGVFAAPPFMVAKALADRSLVRVLPDWRIAHSIPIWGVVPHRAYVPARAQAVLDAVTEVVEAHRSGWDESGAAPDAPGGPPRQNWTDTSVQSE